CLISPTVQNGNVLSFFCFVEENNCPEGFKCCPLTNVTHPPNKAHKGCCAKYRGTVEKPKQ
nr:RecName: Full=U-scutigerotoxin(02)-Tl4a; Short=U-SCUTX(02)-Tl4a; Flags: Precursor [Thereuopoda longicornis]P0DPW2.1 RecName: Full=U-scutigerotoxin(03)-Tl1a; Short=U-SCUTX(03)-Tl1a; Flags: Precursor [Thereuopoda longicornis]